MISDRKDYERYLANVAWSGPASILKMRLPIDEPIYQIDWNTRKVSAPPFIGVEGDHQAEFIFFEMDRFYDMTDLADTIGLIIFRNAKNEEYCQLIPYYDIYSIDGKIIFPWLIQAPAALYSGTVSFSFKFYKVDQTIPDPNDDSIIGTQKIIFELNTLIAKTKVLNGWINSIGVKHTYNVLSPDSIIFDDDTLKNLNMLLSAAKHTKIYWLETDNYEQGMINPDEYGDGEVLDPALPSG